MKYEWRRVGARCPNCGGVGWTVARVPRGWKQDELIEQPHLVCEVEDEKEDDDGVERRS